MFRFQKEKPNFLFIDVRRCSKTKEFESAMEGFKGNPLTRVYVFLSLSCLGHSPRCYSLERMHVPRFLSTSFKIMS
mgnify:CR=1 FL=1